MAASPVSRPGQLQMRDITFAARIRRPKEFKQNDTSFDRTTVIRSILLNSGMHQASDPVCRGGKVRPGL